MMMKIDILSEVSHKCRRAKDWAIRTPGFWAVVAFLIGFTRHYLPFLYNLDGFIFGDMTDGYFNLWVMEHARNFFTSGDLQEYINTRFFVPDNKLVLFWSDMLLFPSLLYSFLFLFAGNMIAAYNLTTLALIGMGFWISWDFFRTVYIHAACLPEKTNIPASIAASIALLTYVTMFSDSRLMFTFHFQNQMSSFVLLGFSCALRYSRNASPVNLWGILGTCLILLYSAPYYALFFALLLAFFLLFYTKAFGFRSVLHKIKAQGWIVFVAIVLCVPAGLGYLAMRTGYDNQDAFCSQLQHVFLPDASTRLGSHLQRLGFNMPSCGHESLAYSGFFIAPVMLALLLAKSWQRIPARWHIKPLAFVCLGTVIVGIRSLIGHGRLASAFDWIALLSVLAVLCMTALASRSRLAPIWLLLAVFVSYGTALGPTPSPVRNFNPSLWGVLAEVVPAYDSIRAVGRFGALGFSFALGLSWYAAITLSIPRPSIRGGFLAMAVLLGAVGLSVVVDVPRAPNCNRYDFSALSPTPSEKKFFDDNPCRILILPVNNLSLIPGHMLYFEKLPTVELVNGYSGKLSPLVLEMNSVKDMMDMGFVSYAMSKSKPTHLVLDKRAYSSENTTQIAKHFSGAIRLENPRFQLIEISPAIQQTANPL
jgi:hypothetical protein